MIRYDKDIKSFTKKPGYKKEDFSPIIQMSISRFSQKQNTTLKNRRKSEKEKSKKQNIGKKEEFLNIVKRHRYEATESLIRWGNLTSVEIFSESNFEFLNVMLGRLEVSQEMTKGQFVYWIELFEKAYLKGFSL